MSNEITHNTKTGLTLYACRFQPDGDVFLTNGATDEVWGTAGRDADDYDVTVTEEDGSGHYKGDFDTSANITVAAAYPVTVYRQLGANPADSDPAIAQGVIDWDGTAEITLVTLDADITLIVTNQDTVKNVYGPDIMTTQGAFPESEL
jgi:hypothetical protein